METFFVETNGLRHTVQEGGSGDRTIIFLHYLGGTAGIWRSLINCLPDSIHWVAPDLRGHGESDQPATGYDLRDFSKDVKGIMDVLGIEKAHFVGSSFGCDVALRFAYDYPGRVQTLIMSEGAMSNETGPFSLHRETKEAHLAKWFDKPEATFSSREAYCAYLQKEWLPWNEAKALYSREERLLRLPNGRYTAASKQETMRQIVSGLFDYQLEDLYRQVRCPVLFLPAENEQGLVTKLAFIEHVKPLLLHTETHIFPNSTHTMMFDTPMDMAQLIARWIDHWD